MIARIQRIYFHFEIMQKMERNLDHLFSLRNFLQKRMNSSHVHTHAENPVVDIGRMIGHRVSSNNSSLNLSRGTEVDNRRSQMDANTAVLLHGNDFCRTSIKKNVDLAKVITRKNRKSRASQEHL